MKILFLCNKLPHCHVAGGHQIIFQRIRYLVEAGHQVGVLSFVRAETDQQKNSLSSLVSELKTLPHPRRNILVRAFHDYPALSRPAVFWKSYSLKMMQALGNVVEEGGYDAVIAEFSEMGQYLHKNPYLSAVNKLISCHRCVTDSYEKYKDLDEVKWRLYLKSLPQIRGLENYEFEMYRSADRTLVLTPQDRFTMQYYAPDLSISVVSAGVDINYLQDIDPVEREPIVLMTGYMKDPANDDGAKWFFHHVWPKLRQDHPDVKLFLVGAEPSRRLQRMVARDSRVVLTGAVDDLRSYRNRARVMVSPVRLGSGIRTKVLQAMASGIPVVSTALGMAGIEAQTGVNCLVADTPELFTRSVDWLLRDGVLRERMAQEAQKLAEKQHALDIGMHRLETILKSVIEGKSE